MFHFIDPKFYEDQPADAIGAAGDALYAVSSLVAHADEEIFSERNRRGLYLIFNAITTVLDDSAETVARMISEPRAEGYREGSAWAGEEYRRGYREGLKAADEKCLRGYSDAVKEVDKAHRKSVNNGRNSLHGDISRLYPEWAEQHLTKVQGVARVT